MTRVEVPAELARAASDTWGAAGRAWLERLPALARDMADRWSLELGRPLPMTFHWVASARRSDGSRSVLKLGVPREEMRSEATALTAYDGNGAVRLLAADLPRGALLLEAAEPGEPLSALVPGRDEEATGAAVDALLRLHAAAVPASGLVPVHDLGRSLQAHLRRDRPDGWLPRPLVERAAGLLAELCVDPPRDVVLHGDLHHGNLLRATRRPWLAIDPHGAVGDPGYDVGALLYNPRPGDRDEDLLRLVPRRVEQLADGLALPVERVVGWGFVKAVLSEVWGADGGWATAPGRALDVARLLERRLR